MLSVILICSEQLSPAQRYLNLQLCPLIDPCVDFFRPVKSDTGSIPRLARDTQLQSVRCVADGKTSDSTK